MWKFTKIQLNGHSPMQEIMCRCSNSRNLRLVIYNLRENRVDCATVSPQEVRKFTLSSPVVTDIKSMGGDGKFAILAYDLQTERVYLVDLVPELNAASAVLLCVVTELIGGQASLGNNTPCNQYDEEDCDELGDEYFDDEVLEEEYVAPEVVRRDARGRFIPKNATHVRGGSANEEPWRNIPQSAEGADNVMGHRFRLGSRRF